MSRRLLVFGWTPHTTGEPHGYRPETYTPEAQSPWTALVGVADARSEYVMVRGILNHVADRAQSLALAGPSTADTTAEA